MQRLATRGIMAELDLVLQAYLWHLYDDVPGDDKDYFHVFELRPIGDGKLSITHIQEEPEYKNEVVLEYPYEGAETKIYIINDVTHETMLFASEY